MFVGSDQESKLMHTNEKLRTYTGELLEILGAIDVTVEYQSQLNINHR